ncbi:13938_t:CDS:1 [Funneliformis caledonium]|uniref:13938_t:CDS:1 n=1 Tax=Funneliformis caledonium TaxID=1117310 RepID=A0A9N9EPG0_9GLOM|nr:13938_t:CDS:1 [Funneliformis caledonium]
MLRNIGRKNTNHDYFTSLVSNKVLTKKQNTTQTVDSNLIVEYPTTFTESIVTKNTNTMEVNPVAKSSTNNFNKEKGPEIFTLETSAQKTTMSINESFDLLKNILDTFTLNFEASQLKLSNFSCLFY